MDGMKAGIVNERPSFQVLKRIDFLTVLVLNVYVRLISGLTAIESSVDLLGLP